jgi:hypothetical protein
MTCNDTYIDTFANLLFAELRRKHLSILESWDGPGMSFPTIVVMEFDEYNELYKVLGEFIERRKR